MAEPIDPEKPVSRELTGRIGRYEILRPLGRGAMGQVYVAHDTVLERDVALKVMVAQIADDPELKRRFEREARAVAKMTHPNVVTVFDLGSHTDGSPYIAMELLRGQDLLKTIRQGPMSLERRVAIVVQVLAGLAHAHHAGIVHRDIKPANIFIQEDGSVKIMDFGVARLTTASLTSAGDIVGTADYMSPEQVQGAKVDGRSDLFSVGCVLFELLTGRRPFHSESLVAIFYKITHEDPGFELVPKGPDYESLLPFLKKALAKNVAERYQTAYDFAIALREWLSRYATSASSRNVLEALVDLEPMTHPPGPDSSGSFAEGATVQLSERGTAQAPSRASPPPTRALGPTVLSPSASQRVVPRVPRRVAPAPKPRPLRWAALGLAIVGVAAAAWLAWRSMHPAPVATSALQRVEGVLPSPAPPPTTAPTPAPPPVTAAPPPTFAQAEGAGVASLRSAQSAFRAGNYARAVEAAQEALRNDPGSAGAKGVLESARAGQQAAASLRTAEAALSRGDLTAADEHTAAALRLAPWDRASVELRSRVEAARREAEAKALQAQHDAEAKSRQARLEQLNAWLTAATGALEKKQYDVAITTYDRVLELDPGNTVAQIGKTNAIAARDIAAVAAGAGRAAPAARSFVPGRTETKAPESSAASPAGFESSAGVVVKRATQAADLPGRIVFEVRPAAPQIGETFLISAHLHNDGSQPIRLATMRVATTVNGKVQKGSLSPRAQTVTPNGRALLYEWPSMVLREGTSSWTMEIELFTATGESYRNTLVWK